MAEHAAFVSVHDVFVNYTTTASLLDKISGRNQSAQAALQHVSFDIPLGTHVTVYGHEGAGKTTLLRLLAGAITPAKGSVRVNGQPPRSIKQSAAGYVSSEESEPHKETGHQILSAFAKTHGIDNAAARIREVSDIIGLTPVLHTPADALSTAQRLKLNMTRSAIPDTPLVLLDDVADQLGGKYTASLIEQIYAGRTVLIATRHASTTDQLGLPVLLLHGGSLAHFGTIDEIATNLACPRIIDIWVEGLRYDLLRQVRRHTGVAEARLIPSNQFAGQRLRITLHSARYLPSLYDLVSQAPLVKVAELPPSLNDIITRLK